MDAFDLTKEEDGPGNVYIDVGPTRVTYVRRDERDEDADWAGVDVIRTQTYREGEDRETDALHAPGVEIPVTETNIPRFQAAITALLFEMVEP